MDCLDNWSNINLGVSVRVFWDAFTVTSVLKESQGFYFSYNVWD